jgi:serine/threonine-protein kinase
MAEAQSFGKYLLMRKLAAGGMGEVFLAKQQGPEGFEKFLVIKRILSHHTDNPDYVDMFFAEARLAAKMSHSNIVQIFEMGEIDGAFFIAMEYVNGKSMKDIIDAARAKGVKLEPAHIADMIIKLASGLGYAHNLSDMSGNVLNIIHRDVNPHNALVSYGGETKVIDFGIAKSDSNEHKTETGTIKGKFVYMSPEQSAAEKIDKRSDIFSIGIVLYEMLAGENPFQKPNIVLSLDAIQRYNPPPPSTLDPAFAPFDPIVKKALEKKADDRYQDCAELVADLQRALLSGEIPRPTKTMQQLMHELFRESIDKEQRFIQEFLKSGTNVTVVPSRPRPGSGAFARGDFSTTTSPEVMAPPVHLTPPPHNAQGTNIRTNSAMARRKRKRVTFYALMGAITIAAISAVVIIINAGPAVEEPTNRIAINIPDPPAPTGQLTPPPVDPTPTPPPKQADPPPADKGNKSNNDKGSKGKGEKDRGRKDSPKEASKSENDGAKEVSLPPKGNDSPSKKEKEKEKEEAAARDDGGTFMIYPTPAAPVYRDGSRLSSGAGPTRVDVSRSSGTIKVGDASSPFQITMSYKVSGKNVELSVDSSPWAILKRDGLSVGRTPRPSLQAGAQTQRFEFVSPQVQGTMIVVVKFSSNN